MIRKWPVLLYPFLEPSFQNLAKNFDSLNKSSYVNLPVTCTVLIQLHLSTKLKSLSKSYSHSLMCNARFCVECAFIYGLRKPRFGPGFRTRKRTVETIYFSLISILLDFPKPFFHFLLKIAWGFGLETAGNGCSQCRGFQFFDPKLLWCCGAASEKQNS